MITFEIVRSHCTVARMYMGAAMMDSRSRTRENEGCTFRLSPVMILLSVGATVVCWYAC